MQESSETYDVVVLGAGVAGLATALFVALEGLRPAIFEHTGLIGGTSAVSAGSVWIPGTEAGRAVNPMDTPERAFTYLRGSAPAGDPAMQRRFLELGVEAVALLARDTEVQLRPYAHHPDYLSDIEGGTACGRALEPVPFDGRRLGADLALIQPPIPEFTLLGGMMVDRTDIRHLMGALKSRASALHVARLLTRHTADRIRGRRSSRMVMGQALVGRLLLSLKQRDVPIFRNAEVTALRSDGSRVTGVSIRMDGREREVKGRAVVLAGGGFTLHPEMRRDLVPDMPCFTPGAPGRTGKLIELALALGARLGEGGEHAFWTPVSTRLRKDGSRAVFPHFVLDRAKPGTLVVDQSGRRFLDESSDYHRFGQAMIAAHAKRPAIPAYLIADHRALMAYGLGMVRPGGWGLRRAERDGYVVSAPTLAALAAALKMDADALQASVARMKDFARIGIDAEFKRGSTVYARNLGDPAVAPNPTLGPIDTPPFHAIRLYPGDIGASTGLVTDADSRVLAGDQPIAGLFAVGNDRHSVMGGGYPGPGITLGPAIAFAYAAARAAAREIKGGA